LTTSTIEVSNFEKILGDIYRSKILENRKPAVNATMTKLVRPINVRYYWLLSLIWIRPRSVSRNAAIFA